MHCKRRPVGPSPIHVFSSILTEYSHCPWVDNCIGVNNHKHFMLYIMSLVAGIGFLIRLTIACKSHLSSLDVLH